jgi:tetratricopeptide (TPR) repeat protein
MSEPNERQYWLWVTRPDYYLEDDGSDRELLDPTHGADTGGWWTCHRDTKKGDLIFLWRTSPKKDIGYLIQAESDAYSIVDDNDQGWDYGCDFDVLFKFENPIHIKDLRGSPSFEEWGPLRGSFQKTTFKISLEYWNKINNLAANKNPGYQEIIELIQKEPLSEGIRLEEELENELVANLDVLKRFGHQLELYIDSTSGQIGRQFICQGNGSRIDLLCYDKTKKRYVVIELKNVRAGQNTFGQISNYMGWVQNRIAGNIPVIGIVISRGYDTRFESALNITDKISQIDVEDLGFVTAPPKRIQKLAEPKEKNTSPLGIKFTNSREAKTWLGKGDEFLKEAKYKEAILCYEEVLKKDPKNKWGWINKGLALAELKRPEDAMLCLKKAIEMYPKSAQVWLSKGIALICLNKFEDSIVALDKAIELKPKFANAWNYKGMALADMERNEEALIAIDRAIELNHKNIFALSNKGYILTQMGKYDEAVRAFDEAIKLDPQDAFSWHTKGDALDEQGKHDDAIQAYDKAMELNPKNAYSWNNKGYTLTKQGKYEKAIQAIDKAIELDANFADPWSNKGDIFSSLGKYDDAISFYDRAIELDPEDARTWNKKGSTLKSLGHLEDAEAAFAKARNLGYEE